MAIGGLDFGMLFRADLMCSVSKPRSTSVLGRSVCAIDSFLSLSGLCRIVCKIKFESPKFKPRKIGWIDNNFVGIVIIFSDNVEGPV